MLIKLAALAAAGYAGYKYFYEDKGSSAPRVSSRPSPNPRAVAGGPISGDAQLIHPGEELPSG
ncbi:hypothetical protein [Croceibacterium mercuriale]|uniref:hypothetical protein n=1 Tax=Croceibacterium mercuriale TaxID=1572751 RepID=UPI00126A04B1|nr:hypothetical protein [Croceibacterium mercuriale]